MADYTPQPTGLSFTGIVNSIVNLTQVMSKLQQTIANSFVALSAANVFTGINTFQKPPVIAAGSNNTATVLPEGGISTQSSAAGVGSVGAAETVLFTYTLPANTLDATNRAMRFRAFGTIANNANAKTIRFYFGTVVFTVAAPLSVAASWHVEGWLVKTGASTQMMHYRAQAGATVINPSTVAGAESDSGGIVIKVTGQATTNNDILANAMIVEYQN